MLETVSPLILKLSLFLMTAVATHMVMLFGQTLLHYKVAHHPIGGKLFGTGTHRTSARQAQTLQAYRTSMREDGAELRLVRRACSRLHLDQIRPHGLDEGFIKRRAGALTNLPQFGKVVSTKVGCGRFEANVAKRRQPSPLQEGTMMAPISKHDSLITRRSIVIGAAASLMCAPAIVRAASLTPVRCLRGPIGPRYAGLCQRLMYQSLDSNLTAGRMSTTLNGENNS
jgi:hypothetical protein